MVRSDGGDGDGNGSGSGDDETYIPPVSAWAMKCSPMMPMLELANRSWFIGITAPGR